MGPSSNVLVCSSTVHEIILHLLALLKTYNPG